MKKLFSLLVVATFLSLFSLTSCRKDDPETKTEFQILTEYMASNNMDLSDVLGNADAGTKWVKPKHKIGYIEADGTVPNYYIMDFRSADDFSGADEHDGHIIGAHNVAFVNLLTEAPADKTTKILCVCYTGQTAARATALLRLAGYTNAFSLKWGMACWSGRFEYKWDGGINGAGHANWITTGSPTAITSHDDPSISTGSTNGADILTARIQAVLDDSWIVANTDVLANPGSYFINNKWSLDAWNTYGHITGAYRIDGTDLAIAHLDSFSPTDNVITYCYTGQTSSITTAWLNVLGFENAKSLKFGANAVVYDGILATAPGVAWKGTGSGSDLEDYVFVTTP